MTPERWVQIEELFHRAAECDANRRAALLDEICNKDLELRREVEQLLSYEADTRDRVRAAIDSEVHDFGFSLIGEVVSHYRILDAVGGGGMGLVYRAEDTKLGRQVALKFLPEESAKDPAALRRFEREARAASALEHPNICPVYEFGEHEGLPFLVMQLLEGQTLRELLENVKSQTSTGLKWQITKGRALALDHVLGLAVQIANGLRAAHQKGIIHRDIKPANIFVTNQNQVKILDFGLTKLAHSATAEPDEPEIEDRNTKLHLEGRYTASSNTSDSLSRTGVAIGTVGYMSPEQARGEKLDARSDIFSFGLVLYEMATGHRAFEGDTGPALHDAIITQTPVPARQLNPGLPTKLVQMIARTLEKDCEARYQTAAEMCADLEALQRELAPKHLPRSWAAVLAIGATLFAAITVVLLKRQPQTISVAPEIRLRQLTTNSSENPVIGGAISPDGKYLAYSDTRGLHIKIIDTGETRSVPRPEALKDQSVKWDVAVWFPDSTRFMVNIHPSAEEWNEWSSATASIWAVSVMGGAPTKLRDHALGCAVSPDGSAISFATNRRKLGESEIWLMGPSGAQARRIYETKEGTATDCWGWSPDGKHYLYVSRGESGTCGLSRPVEGGPPITLLGDAELSKINDFVWLHDGRVIYDLPEPKNGSVCNYWTMRFDLSTGRRLEEPRRLTNWPSFCVSSGSATNDDKRLAFAAWSSFYTSYIADLEASGTRIRNPRHFTLEDSDDFIADWTADSKSVIVAQNRRDHYGLYKQSLDSDTPEPIAASVPGGYVNFALMSPDGKWVIAFIWPVVGGVTPNRPSSPLPIMRIPIAGGAPETILPVSRPSPVSCARPPANLCIIAEVTDDQKQMIVSAFDAVKGRGSELTRFDLDRSVDVFVDNLLCAISPNGTRLAIARSPESPLEIHSLRGQLIHTIPSRVPGKFVSVGWAADQQGLFVTRRAQGGTELLHIDLKGTTQSLYRCTGWGCFASPSPDGRHLAIFDNKQSTNMWMMENF